VIGAASAPAKVMLFGEYAVLHGHRSLALCLDRRIRCSATAGGGRLTIVSPGVFEPPIDLPADALEQAEPPDERLTLLWPILRKHARGLGGVGLRFEADFPPTWGLGSSSASTLAAAAALAGPGRQRFVEARDAQRRLQGSASGYDVATQLLGGYVAYRDGDPAELSRVEPGAELRWVILWTGRKVGTGGMIRRVSERFEPSDPIFEEIGAVAEAGIDAVALGDVRGLGTALDAGHGLLERLGAVPGEISAIVRALQADPDVLGIRLCGAGGGDCLALLADDVGYASEAARRHGLQVLDVAPEPQGLTFQTEAG